MKIEIIAEKEDITPSRLARTQGYVEGFSEAVREVKKQAEGRWGWCTAVVRVTTKRGVGEASLGACSYYSAEDFVTNSGYFNSMLKDALADIERQSLIDARRHQELMKG